MTKQHCTQRDLMDVYHTELPAYTMWRTYLRKYTPKHAGFRPKLDCSVLTTCSQRRTIMIPPYANDSAFVSLNSLFSAALFRHELERAYVPIRDAAQEISSITICASYNKIFCSRSALFG